MEIEFKDFVLELTFSQFLFFYSAGTEQEKLAVDAGFSRATQYELDGLIGFLVVTK